MLNASAVQDRGGLREVAVLSSARWSYVVVGWQPQVVLRCCCGIVHILTFEHVNT